MSKSLPGKYYGKEIHHKLLVKRSAKIGGMLSDVQLTTVDLSSEQQTVSGGLSGFAGMHLLGENPAVGKSVGFTSNAADSDTTTTQVGVLLSSQSGGSAIDFYTTDNYTVGMKKRMIINPDGSVDVKGNSTGATYLNLGANVDGVTNGVTGARTDLQSTGSIDVQYKLATGGSVSYQVKSGTSGTFTNWLTVSETGAINVPTSLKVAGVDVLTTYNYGNTAGTTCEGNDPRLSDARTPVAHNHDASHITTGTMAVGRLPSASEAGKGVVQLYDGSDSTSLTMAPTANALRALQESFNAGLGGAEPAFTKQTGFNKDFGTTAGTVAEGNHTHDASHIVTGTVATARLPSASTIAKGVVQLSTSTSSTSTILAATASAVKTVQDNLTNGLATKEPTITKNTAFNKNFGTSAGQVAEGNHNHDSRYVRKGIDAAGAWNGNYLIFGYTDSTNVDYVYYDDTNNTFNFASDSPKDIATANAKIAASDFLLGGTSVNTLFATAAHNHSASNITSGTLSNSRLNSASTTGAGIVQLYGGFDSISTTLAPTAKALTDAVSSLQSNIDGKANTSHTHAASDITSGVLSTARLPSASTTATGIVQLSSSTASTSTTLAATASAVKTAYDLAAGKANASHTHAAADITSGVLATARLPSASTTGAGIVQLNNTISSTLTTQAATANAVKTAYDLAAGKADASHTHAAGDITSGTMSTARLPSASTTGSGIVQLSTSTASTSTTLAATASAVKSAYDLAAGKADSGHNHNTTYLGISAKAADSNLLDGINSSSFLRSDADDIFSSTYLRFNDNSEIRLGTGSDFRMHFNGTNAYFNMVAGDLYLSDNGTNRFLFDDAGTFHADGDIWAYSTSVGSDPRLKKNIKRIENALDKVKVLNGYTFDWIRNGNSDAGVLSTEVRQVVPEIVKEIESLSEDGVAYDKVNYNGLIGLLIEAVKDLDSKVTALGG